MHASGCGHIVHCTEFICFRYTDTVVSYLHMMLLAYVEFEGHICSLHIYACSMIYAVIVHCFVLFVCAVLSGLHVDYITSAVGHMCLMWQAYMFRVICQ